MESGVSVGRLDDAGVAGDERGKELPAGDGHGEVPRRDEADDADGHADAHGEFVLAARWAWSDAEEPPALAGHVKRFVDGLLHVAAGFGQHLAHFAGHVAGVLLLAFWSEDAGAEQDLSALGRGNQAPGGEGLLCGGDGQRQRLQRREEGNAPTTSEWSAGFRLRMVLPLAAGSHWPPIRLW